MKKLNSEEIKTIIISVLLMVVGILFCCSLSIGIDGLSVIIGLILMIVGVLFLVNLFVGDTGLFSIEAILGVLILSLGILFISSRLAGIIFAYIPWFLIVLGVVVLVDALINRFLRQKDSLTVFIIKLAITILSIALGLCLQLIDGFVEYASIVIGVLMIVYAGYLLYTFFLNKKAVSK